MFFLRFFSFLLSSQSIDPGQQFTWENSNMEVNKPKNRYANVIAYDHSRVVLTSVDGRSSRLSLQLTLNCVISLVLPRWEERLWPAQIQKRICVSSRSSWQRLHQRKLHRWLQKAECLHRHTGATAGDTKWFLEDGVGAEIQYYRHDDPTGGEVTGKDSDSQHMVHVTRVCVSGA